MKIQQLLNQPDTILLDVREPYEFAAGHAEGAINIPLGELQNRLAEIHAFGKPILVYCRSGMRSAQAERVLRACGVADVYNAGALEAVMNVGQRA